MLHVSVRDPIGGSPTTSDDDVVKEEDNVFQHEVRSAIVSTDLQGISGRLRSRYSNISDPMDNAHECAVSYVVARESTKELLLGDKHPWCSGIDGCFSNNLEHATIRNNPQEETQEKLSVSFREPDEPFDILQVEQTIEPQTSSSCNDRHLSPFNASIDNVLIDALPSIASTTSRSSTASISTEVEPCPCPCDPPDTDRIQSRQRFSNGDGKFVVADITAEATSSPMTDTSAPQSPSCNGLSPHAGENVPSYLPTSTKQTSLIRTCEDDSVSTGSSPALNESDLGIEAHNIASPTIGTKANTELPKISETTVKILSEENKKASASDRPFIWKESVEAMERQDSEPELFMSSFAEEETDPIQSLDDALWLESIEAVELQDSSTQIVLNSTVENGFESRSSLHGSRIEGGHARTKHWWRQPNFLMNGNDDLTLGATKHTSNRSRSRLNFVSEGEECVEAVENHGSGTLLFCENSNRSTRQLKEDQGTFVATATTPSITGSRSSRRPRERTKARSKLCEDTVVLDRVIPQQTDAVHQMPVSTNIELQLESKQRKRAVRRSILGMFSCKRHSARPL